MMDKKRVSENASALDETDEQDDHGNHQEDMDEATDGVAAHKTEQPENNEDEGDRV